jgi:hypothetical protein
MTSVLETMVFWVQTCVQQQRIENGITTRKEPAHPITTPRCKRVVTNALEWKNVGNRELPTESHSSYASNRSLQRPSARSKLHIKRLYSHKDCHASVFDQDQQIQRAAPWPWLPEWRIALFSGTTGFSSCQVGIQHNTDKLVSVQASTGQIRTSNRAAVRPCLCVCRMSSWADAHQCVHYVLECLTIHTYRLYCLHSRYRLMT